MKELKEKRYQQVSKAGTEITRLVEENQKYFQALESTESWQAYLEYIDKIVTDGLLLSIASSIGYLLDETDATLTQGVLFEIRLELAEPDIIFRPPLDKNLQDNFYDSVSGYIDDILHMSEIIPRVAKHKDAGYDMNAVKAAKEAAAKDKKADDE
jgi:dynein heavy chain